MRFSILAALGLAVGAALPGASPAQAQPREYAWCLEESTRGGGFTRNCGFMTLSQCVATKSSPGGGNCYRNPAFRGFAGPERQPYRRDRGR
jgi:hypothetical protein